MCMSLRGGTYYGASIHITIGLLFLGGFFVDLLGIAEIWHNPYATYFTLILALIYIILFIVFGLLVFRGTEKESGRLLKGSIAGFVSLQISAFFVYLIILAITNSIRNSKRAAAIANSSSPVPTKSSNDLSIIEEILEQASNELKHNRSSVHDIIIDQQSTPSPELDVNLALFDDEPIISIYQIVVIIFGAIATLAYTSVVVMYIKEILSEENTRIRTRS